VKAALSVMLLVAMDGGLSSAQQNPNPCSMVKASDVGVLLTLNQAEIKMRPGEPDRFECDWEAISAFGEVGELRIRRYDMGTHAEALHRMQQDFPLYWEKKPALVKTNDPEDHVETIDGNEVEAVHGQYKVELNVERAEDTARAHPTWEYRLQRTALQAAGAVIVPTEGLAPDPVQPQREPASESARRYAEHPDSGTPWWTFCLLGFVLFVLLAVYFGVYRTMIRPAIRRRRLNAIGLPGTARIDSVEDTGTTINENPLVRYDCTVMPEVGMPYQASTKELTSRLHPAAMQVGTVVPVKIDPNDPQIFLFA